ncbi:MAG: hypothetical protein IPG82_17715 [Saprospiraceae bacterium]|nr:hypothetical protein [Saprospiraceae bacterium]
MQTKSKNEVCFDSIGHHLLLFLFSCKRSESDPASFTYQAGKDYPNYGGNKANNRYSPLSQINLENVQNLPGGMAVYGQRASRYHRRNEENWGDQCQP